MSDHEEEIIHKGEEADQEAITLLNTEEEINQVLEGFAPTNETFSVTSAEMDGKSVVVFEQGGQQFGIPVNPFIVHLTQLEYEALSPAEKTNGTIYLVNDGNIAQGLTSVWRDNTLIGNGTSGQPLGLANNLLRNFPSVQPPVGHVLVGTGNSATPLTFVELEIPDTAPQVELGQITGWYDQSRNLAFVMLMSWDETPGVEAKIVKLMGDVQMGLPTIKIASEEQVREVVQTTMSNLNL